MRKQVNKYFCDFCGRSQDEVEVMIVGPADSSIYGTCKKIAMDIVVNYERKSPHDSENSTVS